MINASLPVKKTHAEGIYRHRFSSISNSYFCNSSYNASIASAIVFPTNISLLGSHKGLPFIHGDREELARYWELYFFHFKLIPQTDHCIYRREKLLWWLNPQQNLTVKHNTNVSKMHLKVHLMHLKAFLYKCVQSQTTGSTRHAVCY